MDDSVCLRISRHSVCFNSDYERKKCLLRLTSCKSCFVSTIALTQFFRIPPPLHFVPVLIKFCPSSSHGSPFHGGTETPQEQLGSFCVACCLGIRFEIFTSLNLAKLLRCLRMETRLTQLVCAPSPCPVITATIANMPSSVRGCGGRNLLYIR